MPRRPEGSRSSVRNTDALKNAREMRLHRLLADTQSPRYLFVRKPFADKCENLELPGCQLLAAAALSAALQKGSRLSPRAGGVAPRRRANGGHDLTWIRFFQHVTRGAGVDGIGHVMRFRERCEHHHPDLGVD